MYVEAAAGTYELQTAWVDGAPGPPTYPRRGVHTGMTRRRDESRDWVAELRADGRERDAAFADLHALLLRGARFELNRRQASLPAIARGELDDLALQAAHDAMVAILAKLETFRGESRFTTWAYKFVLLEAAVKARRRAWQGREVVLAEPDLLAFADPRRGSQEELEDSELLRAIAAAVRRDLTQHQREVFCALALNGVPIDVLAERRGTTRGALYKTLHDARRRLRAALADAGYTTTTGGGS
jgi:RNA polymerase sigma-70 factor (ECF subfamily)